MIGVTIVDSSVSSVHCVCSAPAGKQDAAASVDLKRHSIAKFHHVNTSWHGIQPLAAGFVRALTTRVFV